MAERGGSWQHSEMARLAGKFAGIVLVDVPGEQIEALRAALDGLGARDGLAVTITAVEGADAGPAHVLTLHLMGQDRPGIVQQVSAALAEHGVSIEELHTNTPVSYTHLDVYKRQDYVMADGDVVEFRFNV